MTTQELLSANRDSIISSIKWTFKVYRKDLIKQKMIEFLAYAQENVDAGKVASARNTKTLLRNHVSKMAREAERQRNIDTYGKANPSLRDIMGKISEKHEDEGKVWNPIHKAWVKNEGVNPAMQKYPQFA